MASTNKTSNLNLSQFIDTDKPSWLTDYNNDMESIDESVGALRAQADAADTAVVALQETAETLSSDLGAVRTAVSAVETAQEELVGTQLENMNGLETHIDSFMESKVNSSDVTKTVPVPFVRNPGIGLSGYAANYFNYNPLTKYCDINIGFYGNFSANSHVNFGTVPEEYRPKAMSEKPQSFISLSMAVSNGSNVPLTSSFCHLRSNDGVLVGGFTVAGTYAYISGRYYAGDDYTPLG